MNTLPLHFLVLTVAGGISRGQEDVSEYLQEENRVFRERSTSGTTIWNGTTRVSATS